MVERAVSQRVGCSLKAVLLEDIKIAMSDLMAIHNREFDALLAEDFDALTDIRLRLQSARNLKASLMDIYREHVTTHGC